MARLAPSITLLLILLFGILLRAPYLTQGLPYIYDEDEGHHFNRTVEMVQKRDWNPHYFHKPSLHFYLRIPAVLGAIWYEKWQGALRSSREIRTRDPYGLARYSYSTSHPSVMIAARSVSLFGSILVILFTFLITRTLSGRTSIAALAALLVSVAPPLLEYSCTVGVDMLMTAFCLGATYFALRTHARYSRMLLFLVGLLCGFAASTKYTAAPFSVLPLLILVARFPLRAIPLRDLLIALLSPLVGFISGSPYILVELSLVREHIGYEIWHYQVAGHEGHSEEPGMRQLLFYLRWFTFDAVGPIILGASLIGIVMSAKKRCVQGTILFLPPLLFFGMMLFQKVNFTRNMLVLIPYIACGGAYALTFLVRHTKLLFISVAALIAFPAYLGFSHLSSLLRLQESRIQLQSWIAARSQEETIDTAIEGELQFSFATLSNPGVEARSLNGTTFAQLYQEGYTYAVVPSPHAIPPSLGAEKVKETTGKPMPQRIVQNPAITVYTLTPQLETHITEESLPLLTLDACRSTAERHCWIGKRVTKFTPPQTPQATLEVMTPWKEQKVKIACNDSEIISLSFTAETVGVWQELKLPVSSSPCTLVISDVHSPAQHGLSKDTRRLGVALRERVH